MKKIFKKRQGELLIIRIEHLPPVDVDSKLSYYKDNLKKQKHLILAEGEATGHKHELDKGRLYKIADKWQLPAQMFFQVPRKQVATLTHTDHEPLTFPEGLYQVITQREYTEKGIIRVRD